MGGSMIRTVLCLLLLSPGCSTTPRERWVPPTPTSESTPLGYSVSGTATVRATRDTAELSVILTHEAPGPREAATRVRGLQDALQSALASSGLAPDQAVSSLQLSPVHEPVDSRGIRTRLRGYEAALTIVLTTSDLDTLPELLELATASGATRIDSHLRVSDRTRLKQQAREAAARAALDKAESMAQILGIQLGSVRSVQETDGGNTSYTNHLNNRVLHNTLHTVTDDGNHGTSEDVTVTVTLTYDLPARG